GFDFSSFFQQILNGVTLGSIYALISLGYTLVYGILLMINFAHSEIFMMGSFFALGLLSLKWVAALPAALQLLVALAGAMGGSAVAAMLDRFCGARHHGGIAFLHSENKVGQSSPGHGGGPGSGRAFGREHQPHHRPYIFNRRGARGRGWTFERNVLRVDQI